MNNVDQLKYKITIQIKNKFYIIKRVPYFLENYNNQLKLPLIVKGTSSIATGAAAAVAAAEGGSGRWRCGAGRQVVRLSQLVVNERQRRHDAPVQGHDAVVSVSTLNIQSI